MKISLLPIRTLGSQVSSDPKVNDKCSLCQGKNYILTANSHRQEGG